MTSHTAGEWDRSKPSSTAVREHRSSVDRFHFALDLQMGTSSGNISLCKTFYFRLLLHTFIENRIELRWFIRYSVATHLDAHEWLLSREQPLTHVKDLCTLHRLSAADDAGSCGRETSCRGVCGSMTSSPSEALQDGTYTPVFALSSAGLLRAGNHTRSPRATPRV